MKKAFINSFSLVMCLLIVGCYGLNDKEVYGELVINPKSGWTSLDFTDPKTNKPFSLVNGQYKLQYNVGFYGLHSPSISVYNAKSELLGNIEIPKESINRDGTFEIYRGGKGNNNSFNILGGRRKIITEKLRYAKDNVECTYTATVSCTTTDPKGNLIQSVCAEIRNGYQDIIYSKNKFYNTYRILFDGQDLINVAVFRAKSQPQEEVVEVDSTACQ